MTRVVLSNAKFVMQRGSGMCFATATFELPQSPFPPKQVVAGHQLLLNGFGTRNRAVSEIYRMGLYTPSKVHNIDELFGIDGPVRLSFISSRDLMWANIGTSLIRALSHNSSIDQILKHSTSGARLLAVFSGDRQLVANDTFDIEFIPGNGTSIFVNGQAQGEPIGDAEFFAMVLKIWIGNVPVDLKLKHALLGAIEPIAEPPLDHPSDHV